jgi:hypothetical protein
MESKYVTPTEEPGALLQPCGSAKWWRRFSEKIGNAILIATYLLIAVVARKQTREKSTS